MIILYSVLILWTFWFLYVGVMGIYRAHLHKQLTPITYVLSVPWVLIGFLVDVAVNFTLASLIFLESPVWISRKGNRLKLHVEFLVTTRLKRHIELAPTSWRGRLSDWVCSHTLDFFDPSGNHC